MRSEYDIIVIGAGSGGLGVSLFMAKVGLKTLLIDKTDEDIGSATLRRNCLILFGNWFVRINYNKSINGHETQ